MEVTKLTQESVVAKRALEVLFKKAEDFSNLEKRVKALTKKYPTWRVGWYNLSQGEIVLVVEFPLHQVSSPWQDRLMKREEYRITAPTPAE